MKNSGVFVLVKAWVVLVLGAAGVSGEVCREDTRGLFCYDRWTVSEPVLQEGAAGTFDEVAVKDPTIVFYKGRYHLFYTSKARKGAGEKDWYLSRGGSALGYVAAERLEDLQKAKRYNLSAIVKEVVVAPQVFYFEPHKLWYLIAHTTVKGRPDLMPIYMTNPDIEDIYGWTRPKIIKTRKANNGFWIDFWVICDDTKAHLFYTDHEGSIFRFECPIGEFPDGYKNAREETVLTERGENEKGRWRLHEANHIYYVKSVDKYLQLVEAVYPHPTRKNYWDSRSRFMIAYVAEKLEGPWERAESGRNVFAGDPANLYQEDGTKAKYDQVSHFELIRSGYNQRLEIEDFKLDLLFQGFDAAGIGSDYDYDELPWELMVMRNY